MSIETTTMDVESFIEIPDNLRQRDTEQHAKKAMKRHLSEYSESHKVVAVAKMNKRIICKLDGHTRAWLWKNKKLTPPDECIVTVYSVASLEEAANLYTHFDNQYAAENTADRVSGALRENGVSLNSMLLNRNNFATALKIANSKSHCTSNEYELITKWIEVLKEIDSWDLPRNKFRGSGLLALALLLVAADRVKVDSAREFFLKFAEDKGKKDGRKRDGVQALTEHMEWRRYNNQMTGYDNIWDMMAKGLTCFNAYQSGAMIVNVQPAKEALAKLKAKALSNLNRGW